MFRSRYSFCEFDTGKSIDGDISLSGHDKSNDFFDYLNKDLTKTDSLTIMGLGFINKRHV